MKKAALILGTIGVIIFLVSGLFKLLHWPAAGLILGYGSLFNLVIVMPVIAIFTLSKDSPNKPLYFFGALSAFIWIAGAVFKFNYLPGQTILLSVGTGLLILFIILTGISIFRMHKKAQHH